jgi:predicted GTPase
VVTRRRILILGAVGRDFHNFNVLFREDPRVEVVAFTATQIPSISGRHYPPALSGPHHPRGIPIVPEEELEERILKDKVDEAWFSYSDVSFDHVMQLASRVTAAGAHFVLASAFSTMLASLHPVVAVTAVRTGSGKSQTTRFLLQQLKALGKRPVAVRHPMPYGDLASQVCQRYASYEDLDRYRCTIEEREEFEPLLDQGFVVYAGVDYERVLREAEKEGDMILWDGGNNDTPFFRPDLHIVVADPHRLGHESRYYPGMTNLLMADVIILNKVNTAGPEAVRQLEESCRRLNPRARIYRCASEIRVSRPELVAGKRVLVVEDGPTVTHGEMPVGAGWYAAQQAGAREIVDPRPYAVGSIRKTFEQYPHLREVLPAMGYGETQIRELEATIAQTPAEVIVEGTPIELSRVLRTDKPIVDVRYELVELERNALAAELRRWMGIEIANPAT